MQSNVLWFKGLEITVSVTLEQPNQGQRKVKPSTEEQILLLTHLSLSTLLQEKQYEMFSAAIWIHDCETSKYTGYRAGQCSGLLS